MPGTPVRILLARHGETVYNVEGRWQGHADSPLTPRGLEQARQLAESLRDDPLHAIYASDLGRAVETAHEVSTVRGLQVIAEPRLREINVSRWTGLTRPHIEAAYPAEFEGWRFHPANVRLPGGETLAEAHTRTKSFFEERMSRHTGETVLIVGHGALHQAIVVEAMGRTLADLWLPQRIDNCQVTELEWTAEGGLQLAGDALDAARSA